MQQFGLLTYRTTNIGDDIQSVAARAFLPRVDHFIDREALASFNVEGRVKLICNGWFAHFPQNWPPSRSISPLLISMHLCQDITSAGIRASDYFLHGDNLEYLKCFAPVGARDLGTLKLLEKAGVPAYFSGCLTLTLRPKGLERRDDLIVLVDVSNEVVAEVRSRTKRKILLLSAAIGENILSRADPSYRAKEASALLAYLESAHCVITTRLHSALPCLAFNTPVFLIDAALDQHRFEGLNRLLRHSSEEKFISSQTIDLDNPEPNDGSYEHLAGALCGNVARFIECEDDQMIVDTSAGRLDATLASLALAKAEIDRLTKENRALRKRRWRFGIL